MGFRWRAVLGAVTCLMLVTSCGAGGPGTSSASPTTTSLPLQKQGLAVGGDVQSRATDVVSVRLTKKQTEELVDACRKVVEVASTGDGCSGALEDIFDKAVEVSGRCKFDLCLTVRKYGRPDMKTLGTGGYVEIVDHRKGRSLCDSESSQVCLRVGIRSSKTLRQIAEPKTSPTSSVSTFTPTPTPSPTTTSPAGPFADESPSAASSPSSSASSSA